MTLYQKALIGIAAVALFPLWLIVAIRFARIIFGLFV